MEYPQSTFDQFDDLIQEFSPLEMFQQSNGMAVSWYDSSDLRSNDNISLSKEISDYIRIDTGHDGNITRVEDEFINLPDNEFDMAWY